MLIASMRMKMAKMKTMVSNVRGGVSVGIGQVKVG